MYEHSSNRTIKLYTGTSENSSFMILGEQTSQDGKSTYKLVNATLANKTLQEKD
jgi:hypothetical protein